MENLSFGLPTNLPPPDQLATATTTGQPTGTSAASTTTATGGATAGVNASKGAATATGVNSLIIEQNIGQSGAIASGLSGMGMDASTILGAAPSGIDPQSMMTSLGTVANDMEQISGMVNAFASSVSTSGGTTTNNSTATVSSDSSSSSQETSTTSTGSGGAPPSMNTISMTEIMNEIGSLTAQQSATMAQQQTAEINAISMQANSTMQQAADMLKGANMMMTMATVGLAITVTSSAYQVGGIGSASKAGDQAEMASLDEGTKALNNASQSSLHETQLATRPSKKQDEAQYNKAQSSIKEMEISAQHQAAKGTISDDQLQSFNNQAAASKAALDQSNYLPGGSLNKDGETTYQGTLAHTQANADAKAAGKGSINSAQDAVDFYNGQAKAAAATRPQSISYAELAQHGITPGQTLSAADASSILGTKDPAQVKALQTSVSNLSLNRNTEAWQRGYSNASQHLQPYAAVGNSLSTLFSQGLAQQQDTQYQAQATEQQAAAQVQSATVQSMQQGVSQTQDLANQLRQAQTSVAQDMQTMVGSTKV